MIASRRMRPGVLAVCLASAALVAGCAVTLISTYDESTDKGVSALQTKADALMTQLDQEHVPAYTAVKSSYDGVRSDLGSLQFRNEARPKNSLTIRQLGELKTQLDTLEALHSTGRLNQPAAEIAKRTIDQTLGAILRLELEKKELNKQEK
jgi:hypothetical protein